MRCCSVVPALAALAVAACGTQHNTVATVELSGGSGPSGGLAPVGGQAGDFVVGGNAGSGGLTATGGTSMNGGRAGAGGSPPAACPPAPPATGTTCSASGQRCVYQDCAAAGVYVASCQGTWSTTATPCGTSVTCTYPASQTCASGQLCLVYVGGTVSAECTANVCGTGPIDCACLGVCSGVCDVLTNTTGISLYCNTCPQGQCA